MGLRYRGRTETQNGHWLSRATEQSDGADGPSPTRWGALDPRDQAPPRLTGVVSSWERW